MLARLQSRNLNGQSPSCVPNEPFGFMNRRFDLKNSFFSSTEYVQGSEMAFIGKNIHLPVC